MTRKPRNPNDPITLSGQQRTALWLFACGNSVENVAKIMMIAGPTAKEHLHRAYRALEARNGTHAVHLAYQLGIFQVEAAAEDEPEESA